MKNVRNLSISALTFLTVLFLGISACQKEQTAVNRQADNVTTVEARAICPTPTYPSITTASPLFEYRYRVALYRYFAKIYVDYIGRAATNSTAIVRDADLDRLGLPEAKALGATNISNFCRGQGVSDAWDRIVEFIRIGNLSNVSWTTRQAMVIRAANWQIAGSYGTYTIIFRNGWDYSGKSTTGQTRTNASVEENGIGTNKFNTCYWNSQNQCGAGTIADYESVMAGWGLPGRAIFSPDRQIAKEEAVRMIGHAPITHNCNDPAKASRRTYNEIASPGINYIKQDGI